jgi:C4-dicarboxylate-specific signal transduction histidine kinase
MDPPSEAAGPTSTPKTTYRWPWFVLAGLIVAVVLAVVWMSYAVKRTRMIRDLNSPSNNTLRAP